MQKLILSFSHYGNVYGVILTYAGDWYSAHILNESLHAQIAQHNIFARYNGRWFRENIDGITDMLIDNIIEAVEKHECIVKNIKKQMAN
jgi:hypothetical protein